MKRLRATAVLLVLALCALLARLVWLQGLGASAYAAQAESQRLRTTTTPATRGEIVDRNGAVLAENVYSRDVYADPAQISDPATEAAKLAPLLGLNVATVTAELTGTNQFVYIDKQITPALGDSVTALDLAGVGLQVDTDRIYPGGDLAADVLGFTNYQNVGVAGIEYEDQSLLAGTAGTSSVEVDPGGRVIPGGEDKVVAAVPGTTVRLTLDRDIQWMALQSIEETVAATHAVSGSVIVLDPHTGDVLADATAPTFSSADPGEANPGSTGNRTVSDYYEPGSVNKVIIAAAALQTHVLTPNTVLNVPAELHIDGSTFHDAEAHGDEHLTMTGVLAKSSNIGAIEIAQRLGNATVNKFLEAFGLGKPTGVGLPGETGGVLPPVNTWGPTTAATIPFGQGMDVTAMQIAAAYGAVANNGVYVQPRIVEGTQSPSGAYTAAAPSATHEVVTPSVATTLRDMLEQVTTENGTAPDAAIPGYLIAGKTGTANAIGANGRYNGNYTATFVGMAPAANPQLVVEVVLDQPKGDYYGGTVSAPVFKKVMSFALQSLDIPPSDAVAPVMSLGN